VSDTRFTDVQIDRLLTTWWLWDGSTSEQLAAAGQGPVEMVPRSEYEAVLARAVAAEEKLERIRAILEEVRDCGDLH